MSDNEPQATGLPRGRTNLPSLVTDLPQPAPVNDLTKQVINLVLTAHGRKVPNGLNGAGRWFNAQSTTNIFFPNNLFSHRPGGARTARSFDPADTAAWACRKYDLNIQDQSKDRMDVMRSYSDPSNYAGYMELVYYFLLKNAGEEQVASPRLFAGFGSESPNEHPHWENNKCVPNFLLTDEATERVSVQRGVYMCPLTADQEEQAGRPIKVLDIRGITTLQRVVMQLEKQYPDKRINLLVLACSSCDKSTQFFYEPLNSADADEECDAWVASQMPTASLSEREIEEILTDLDKDNSQQSCSTSCEPEQAPGQEQEQKLQTRKRKQQQQSEMERATAFSPMRAKERHALLLRQRSNEGAGVGTRRRRKSRNFRNRMIASRPRRKNRNDKHRKIVNHRRAKNTRRVTILKPISRVSKRRKRRKSILK